MISIFYNDIELDLPIGKLTFELNFPGFDEEAILQGKSFPLNFPATNTNDKVFKFGRILNVPAKVRSLNVDVLLDGNLWKKGTIIFSEIQSTQGYRSTIVLDEVFVSLVDKSLKEIDFPPDQFLGETNFQMNGFFTYCSIRPYYTEGYPITFFPVDSPGFYSDSNPSFNGIVNYWDYISVVGYNGFLFNQVPTIGEEMNVYSMVPYLYYHFILERIFAQSKVRLAGSFYNDIEARKLTLPNNFPLDEKRKNRFVKALFQAGPFSLSSGQVIKTILNATIGQGEDDQGFFNTVGSKYWAANSGSYKVKIKGSILNRNDAGTLVSTDIGIYIKIKTVLGGLTFHDATEHIFQTGVNPIVTSTTGAVAFESEIEFEVPDSAMVNACFIWPEIFFTEGSYEFIDSFIEITNYKASDLNQYSKFLKYSNHVPDIQVTTFLNELKKLFGLVYFYDPILKELKIDYIKDYLVIKSETRKLLIKGDYTIKLKEEQTLTYSYDWDGAKDELTKDNFKDLSKFNYRGVGYTCTNPQENDYVIAPNSSAVLLYKNSAFSYYTDHWPSVIFGKGKNKKEVKLSITPMLMTNGRGVIPKVSWMANSPAFGLENTDFGLKAVFTRSTSELPKGSSMAVDYFETDIADGRASLNLIDLNYSVNQSGIISKYLDDYIRITQFSDLLVIKPLLKLTDLMNLNWKERWEISGVWVFPSRITFNIDKNGIQETEAETYTDFNVL